MVKYQNVASSIIAVTLLKKAVAFTPSSRVLTLVRNPATATSLQSTISFDSVTTDEANNVTPADVAYGAMIEASGIAFSGMKGKALSIRASDIPSFADVKSIIPQECFKADDLVSFGYLSVSTAATALCTAFGFQLLNLIGTTSIFTAPIWAAYAAITGTVAMGLWVLAHECGHSAFSSDKKINNIVGFVLHSLLLVPYYSWQHSHAVHHRYTNDMVRGETHVPEMEAVDDRKGYDSAKARRSVIEQFGKKTGLNVWGGVQGFLHLVIGWPAYILVGATGGPARGVTNHFYPEPLFNSKDPNNGVEELFPGKWKQKVYESDIGIAFVVGALLASGLTNGFGQVMALYGGPLLVVNIWLVVYTWLQHTDVDVPHFSPDDHSFMRGALQSIDRPYDKLDPWGVIDFLHHKIGTTHVAHHIDSTIPHYKALKATAAIKDKYPELYLYDPTPIHKALWRVCRGCTAVVKRGDMWVWDNAGVEESI
jgi:omega-6 fatty acid desaturase (delta-12 desaturase)